MRLFLSAIVIVTLLLQSCEKDTGTLGLKTIPDGSQLSLQIDTAFQAVAYSSLDSSLRTTKTMSPFIGSYVDNTFGRTTVNLAVPLYAQTLAINFNDAIFSITDAYIRIERDSLNAYGEKAAVLGNTVTSTPIEIYTLNLSRLDSTEYYAWDSVAMVSKEIEQNKGERIALLNIKSKYDYNDTLARRDSVSISGTQFFDALKTKLTSLLDTSISHIKYRDTAPDVFNNALSKVFKGIYLKVDEGSNGSIQLLKNIRLRIFYKTASGINYWDLVSSSTIYGYDSTYQAHGYIPQKLIPLQIIKHSYPENFASKISQPQSGKLYVQSLCGAKATITLPSIGNLQERYGERYMINAAELRIPILATDTNNYTLPKYLDLRVYYNTTDFFSYTLTRKGAYYYTDLNYLMQSEKYAWRVNTSGYRYEIRTRGSIDELSRVVFDCGENNKNIRLKVYYTKYK